MLFLSLIMNIQAKEIAISSVSASSSMAPADGSTYEAKLLHDSKSTTTWVEDDDGSGLGSWFEVQLAEEADLTHLQLWNGNWYSFNEWDFYNRSAKIEVIFEDGSKETFELANKKNVEELTFKKSHRADSFKVKIKGIHTGSAYAERTAISEIKVFDKSPDVFAKASISASSVLPEDNDGSYNATNLQDGLKDTMWCEGKSGDGSNEKLVYKFSSPTKLSTLYVVNGNGTDFKMFMGYGSVKTLSLNFDNGSTQTITVKPSLLPQEISIDPVSAKKVTVTLNEVKKGSKVNDTCLSELRFE